MQCDEFEARMQKLLDERRRPEADGDLAGHAALCDDCRQWLWLQEQLFCNLASADVPPLRPGFSRDVVRAALAAPAEAVVQCGDVLAAGERHAGRRPRGLRAWGKDAKQLAGVALTIGVLLCVAPLVNWWSGVPAGSAQGTAEVARRNEGEPTAQITKPEAPPSEPPVKSVVDQRPEGTRSVVAATNVEAANVEAAVGGGDLLNGRPAGAMVRSLSSRLVEVPVEHSVEQIPGLGPIAVSFYTAIDAVRRTLPGTKEEQATPQGEAAPATCPEANAAPPLGNDFI